ncbi:MAG: hypothetical protein ISS79_09935 [Phycisphaerae bacterium]|nr:hypothetical protein [Phycisphaerae bacterium]
MKPDPRFLSQPKAFWANVRAISETVGYTVRGKGLIKVPEIEDMILVMHSRKLNAQHIVSDKGSLTELGGLLQEYFKHRADVLNTYVKPRLMDAERAQTEFENLRDELKPSCPMPMNKQKGDKRAEAYLTCLVNMIVESRIKESNVKGLSCDYDPRMLTTVTDKEQPLRTLSRRLDGAFPSVVDPIAVWEIKEYYYTTTFGSRVADGVYETLLDGMELAELKEHEKVHVLHYLITDAYYTWWECGRSYLCRILDSLYMGYIDEVLFGYEVIERLPSIVDEWIGLSESRRGQRG